MMIYRYAPVEHAHCDGERKAGFRSLGDAWAGTTTVHGSSIPTVLGGRAQFESDLMHPRAGEGWERAQRPTGNT